MADKKVKSVVLDKTSSSANSNSKESQSENSLQNDGSEFEAEFESEMKDLSDDLQGEEGIEVYIDETGSPVLTTTTTKKKLPSNTSLEAQGSKKIAAGAGLGPHKEVDFVHILEPAFQVGRIDSLATVPSTLARRFSKDSVRGSALSTRLSDMPSMYSQALIDDVASSAFFLSASTQEFDVSSKSVSDYREKWLTSFMSGYTPKQTFTISIINMITRKQTELRVTKENTLNEVFHMYMQYDDHPENYVWKDIYGRLLIPDKNLKENGLVRPDEILEFQGYRRLPVILLYFRDGFENDPPLPLNPLHALKQREPGLCRNY